MDIYSEGAILKTPNRTPQSGPIAKLALSAFLSASVLAVLITTAQTQQKPANAAGTWHVAIPGWGIEDHMLVLQQEGGAITGKFEFADVKGTVSGKKIAFVVTNRGQIEIASFQGVVSDNDHMKGAVIKGKDSPLPGRSSRAQWTARRGEYK